MLLKQSSEITRILRNIREWKRKIFCHAIGLISTESFDSILFMWSWFSQFFPLFSTKCIAMMPPLISSYCLYFAWFCWRVSLALARSLSLSLALSLPLALSRSHLSAWMNQLNNCIELEFNFTVFKFHAKFFTVKLLNWIRLIKSWNWFDISNRYTTFG